VFSIERLLQEGTKHSSGTHISEDELPVQVSVVETASLGAEAEEPIKRVSDHPHRERV